MRQIVLGFDQVVVHSIDRLARDLRDLQTIILKLNEKGVGIEFLSERLVFSGNNDDAPLAMRTFSPARDSNAAETNHM